MARYVTNSPTVLVDPRGTVQQPGGLFNLTGTQNPADPPPDYIEPFTPPPTIQQIMQHAGIDTAMYYGRNYLTEYYPMEVEAFNARIERMKQSATDFASSHIGEVLIVGGTFLSFMPDYLDWFNAHVSPEIEGAIGVNVQIHSIPIHFPTIHLPGPWEVDITIRFNNPIDGPNSLETIWNVRF